MRIYHVALYLNFESILEKYWFDEISARIEYDEYKRQLKDECDDLIDDRNTFFESIFMVRIKDGIYCLMIENLTTEDEP